MAIDDDTKYGLTGAQIKDLAAKVKAGGGGVKTLTAADYNWPTSNPTGVALWLLEPGIYKYDLSDSKIYVSKTKTLFGGFYLVGSPVDGVVKIVFLSTASNTGAFQTLVSNGTDYGGTGWLTTVRDNLDTASSSDALSARQGKVLKDLIDSLIISGAGAPTTATVGTVGQLYEDTTGGDLYQCTAVSGSTYTWEEVGGGGGGGVNVVQTTGTSTTDVMSQDATTKMIFGDGAAQTRIRIGANSVASGNGCVAIAGGTNAQYATSATGSESIAIGIGSKASATDTIAIGAVAKISLNSPHGIAIGTQANIDGGNGCVALGAYSGANISANGMVDLGSSNTAYGYGSTNYRLLTGLHDPVSDHDAATKKYVDDHSGGGGPTVVQTTGTSTTDVMSQNAVTTELNGKVTSSDITNETWTFTLADNTTVTKTVVLWTGA